MTILIKILFACGAWSKARSYWGPLCSGGTERGGWGIRYWGESSGCCDSGIENLGGVNGWWSWNDKHAWVYWTIVEFPLRIGDLFLEEVLYR